MHSYWQGKHIRSLFIPLFSVEELNSDNESTDLEREVEDDKYTEAANSKRSSGAHINNNYNCFSEYYTHF